MFSLKLFVLLEAVHRECFHLFFKRLGSFRELQCNTQSYYICIVIL